MLGAHAFFRRADETRAIARNGEHLFSGYVTAAVAAGFTMEACTEVPISAEVLDAFGVDPDPMHPERAILGLPFALILTLRRRWSTDAPRLSLAP
jgi:hypothetical protein